MATCISSWDSIGFLPIHREGRLGEIEICPDWFCFLGGSAKKEECRLRWFCRPVPKVTLLGLAGWELAGSPALLHTSVQRYTSPLCESLLFSSETSICSMNLQVLRRFQNGSVTSIIDFFAFWVTCFRKENKDRKRHFSSLHLYHTLGLMVVILLISPYRNRL